MIDSGAQNPLPHQQAVLTHSARLPMEEENDIDFQSLLLLLWRKRWVLMGIVLIGLSLAYFVTTILKPQYSARSLLLIEARAPAKSLEHLQSLIGSPQVDTSLIMSELEVLRSRTLARKVVERLDLMNDPEFNPRFRATMPASDSQADQASAFKNLSLYREELENLPPDVIEQDIEAVVSRFLSGLRVRSIPGSYAIQVEYKSNNPKKTALIANAVLDVYIEQRLEQKFKATKKITDWLDRRLKDLRRQARMAEIATEQYKRKHNLLQGSRTVMSAEQLSQLNSQLVQARAKKAEAEARLSQVEELIENPEQIETSYEIINSRHIQSLKMEQVKQEGRLSEALSRYGEKHPEVLKIKAELAELRKNIQTEMQRVTQSVANEVRLAEARVRALEEGLQEVAGQRMEDNEAMIRLRELEREAESTRLIFDTFLQTYKRSNEQEELQEPEAKVISYAVVPRAPSFPNKPLIMALGMALSLLFGVGLVILLEKMRNAFHSAGQIEKATGYPCYALVPLVEKIEPKDIARYVLAKPSSIVAEAVRSLRLVVNLRQARGGKRPKVITVTSSFPGEGKTTLACWMALLAAKAGDKALLIDMDLRRPMVHRKFSIKNDKTVVEYLTDQAELDEVIKTDKKSGLHMMLGRSVPNSALDLVSSRKMAELIDALRDSYDVIIIDSPACLAVSDARVLATLSDQTLYGVAWDATPREVVGSGIRQFSDLVGPDALGFVMTCVDVKRHVRYGYGDAVYYYGQYSDENA